MHLILPDVDVPTRVSWGETQVLDDDQFYDLCVANPDLRIERNPTGEVVIVAPAGGESDYRGADLLIQLGIWAKRTKKGKTFGASVCFLLPDGAGLSPDTAWVSEEKLTKIPKPIRKKFLPVAPDFVVEVMSTSDRLKDARGRMEQWVANGVGLAWLIDGDNETVFVYRPGQSVVVHKGIAELAGEGPLEGFIANFDDIWEGL